jgi:release factor glutamine methyltransferase
MGTNSINGRGKSLVIVLTNVQDLRTNIYRQLLHSGIVEAQIESEIILMKTLSLNKTALYSLNHVDLTRFQEDKLLEIIKRRIQREPLSYIIGYKEFYGLEFLVDSRVLIPRPETELLVEEVLTLSGINSKCTVADIGTGSGAIAVTLSTLRPNFILHAFDISEGTIAVAKSNAIKHDVIKQINFYHSNLLEASTMKFDFLVANLPYIPTDRLDSLEPEIFWEPHIALDGGEFGVDLINELLIKFSHSINSQGFIILEIDHSQQEYLKTFTAREFPNINTVIKKDLSGCYRVVTIGPFM